MKDQILERVVIPPKGNPLGLENNLIYFPPESKITLFREEDEDGHRIHSHLVAVVMPWMAVYEISRHATKVQAQVAFNNYSNELLRGGYKIQLTAPAQASIVPPAGPTL